MELGAAPVPQVAVAERAGPVAMRGGLRAVADHSLADCPPLDLLLVPGGLGTRSEVRNPALLGFIRDQSDRVEVLASICTGAALLGCAGVLSGLEATTNRVAFDWVMGVCPPDIRWNRSQRWVDAACRDLGGSLGRDRHGAASSGAPARPGGGRGHRPKDGVSLEPEPRGGVKETAPHSYGRADLLEQAYGYDNSGFIQGLEKRGFYVAECSQSNYVRTEISLGSSLNMMYLQDLDPAFAADSTRRSRLWDSLKHSAVRYNLEEMGYKTIAFATGFAWNELEDADIFYTPDSIDMGITEFEVLFLRTTLARYVNELHWIDPDQIMGQNFRDRTMNVFNRVDDIAPDPEPTFAYVHLISPHPPFVFGPNGEPTYPPDFWNENREYPADLYAKGYQNQLTFLNKKMLEAVDTILANSETPPIIVLQGDHGPWLQTNSNRMKILNAYYLPGHNDRLYPDITPVNTFRLIFDAYFGGDYGMLPDIAYFSPVPKLYKFSEVPNVCQ